MRQPGERDPNSKGAEPPKPTMDADHYQLIKRLERERAIRNATSTMQPMSAEDAAYQRAISTRDARICMACTPVEKATLHALTEVRGVTMTAYLLALHHGDLQYFRENADPDYIEVFDEAFEKAYARITGHQTLSQVEADMLKGSHHG